RTKPPCCGSGATAPAATSSWMSPKPAEPSARILIIPQPSRNRFHRLCGRASFYGGDFRLHPAEPLFMMTPDMRVLVVEDDKKIALFVVNGLKQSGYAVDHCADGEAALAMAGATNYDAAVVDLML